MGRAKLTPCPCGLPFEYIACCGRYLEQGLSPSNAEQLMRSRYTAYVLENETYLLKSWHHSTRPSLIAFEHKQTCKWQALIVHKFTPNSNDTNRSTVEFTARYKINGRAFKMHEISQFICENKIWFYLDGIVD